jgi:hypothetical protein
MKTPLTQSGYLLLASMLVLTACNNTDSNATAPTSDSAVAAKVHTDSSGSGPDAIPSEKHDPSALLPIEASGPEQYCYIKKIYTKGDASYVDADFIQFLYGDKAIAAARKNHDAEMSVKDGDTTYSVPNDYYILNENSKIRTLALDNQVKCTAVVYEDSRVVLKEVTLDQLKAKYKDNIYIITLGKDSLITQIKEQYVP